MDNPTLWVSLVVVATAVQPILVKLGYRVELDALQLLLMKNLLSALIVLPFVKSFRWLDRDEFWRIARISVFILGINGFSLLALELLPAAVVVTLTTTVPVFVALVNIILGRERNSFKFWLGLGISLVGVALVTQIVAALVNGKVVIDSWLGVLATFAAIACAVTYRVNMEKLTHTFEPKLLWIWCFWINAVVIFAVALPFVSMPKIEALPLAAGVGLSAAIANSAFLWAIRSVGATSTSVFQLLQRPFILFCTASILGEFLSTSQWMGALLVIVGVGLARPKQLC
ncbi:DMT family transporter [bacterium]|nr:DMT family transporter [bacterium]